MKQFIKYPSIKQYRDVVFEANKNGDTIITCKQQVKLHGTNASVVLTRNGDLYCQSRNRIIDIHNDNHGFANWFETKKDIFKNELELLLRSNNFDCVVVYGEWCGGNIASKVALCELPKMFVAFDIMFLKDDKQYMYDIDAFYKYGGDCFFNYPDDNIHNITYYVNNDAKLVEVDVSDVNMINKLNEMTDVVDKRCPFAYSLGVDGHGEGYVYKSICGNYRFKVKGDSHTKAKQKVKQVSQEDIDNINKANELAIILANNERLQQGLEYLNEMGIEPISKNTGVFIKWVIDDIKKEELDLIEKSGLNEKNVFNSCTKITKDFYFNNL